MTWLKRIFWFAAINIAMIATIGVLTSLLGVNRYLTAQGIDYQMLMGFCLVWGFGGAFFSLALSRILAKWMMSVKVIEPTQALGIERDLLQRVSRLAAQAHIPMPQVGIYESPEVNAFATGPTKSRSLVAVSTGLLNRMSAHEVEGVLAHEIAHIANGDMVTMTLIQGVVNAFVMFFARIVGFAVGNMVDEDKRPLVRMLTTLAFDIVFGILGSLVVAWFSRLREFRADSGGAQLGGRSQMIAALQGLQRVYEQPGSFAAEGAGGGTQALATLKISGQPSRFLALFSTHPPLAERITALQQRAVASS